METSNHPDVFEARLDEVLSKCRARVVQQAPKVKKERCRGEAKAKAANAPATPRPE